MITEEELLKRGFERNRDVYQKDVHETTFGVQVLTVAIIEEVWRLSFGWMGPTGVRSCPLVAELTLERLDKLIEALS